MRKNSKNNIVIRAGNGRYSHIVHMRLVPDLQMRRGECGVQFRLDGRADGSPDARRRHDGAQRRCERTPEYIW